MEAIAELIVGFFSWMWDEIAAWLYRRRYRHEDDPAICRNCHHALQGSLEANLPRCPECGWLLIHRRAAESAEYDCGRGWVGGALSMSEADDRAIATFAHEIERRIPDHGGFITVEMQRDEYWIHGDRVGLLTLGTAIVLRAAAGQWEYDQLMPRTYRMMPGGSLTGITVIAVKDDTEIAKLRKEKNRGAAGWLTCLICLLGLLLVLALAGLGVYTVVMWLL